MNGLTRTGGGRLSAHAANHDHDSVVVLVRSYVATVATAAVVVVRNRSRFRRRSPAARQGRAEEEQQLLAFLSDGTRSLVLLIGGPCCLSLLSMQPFFVGGAPAWLPLT